MWRLTTTAGGICALVALLGQTQTVGTSSIRGRILDDQAQVIPGLIVSVQRVDDSSSQEPLVKTSWADTDGRFEIGALPAGKYRVMPGLGHARVSVVSFPLPGIERAARPIIRSPRPGSPPGSRRVDFVTDVDGQFAEFNAPVFRRDDSMFAFGANGTAPWPDVDLGQDATKSIDVVAHSRLSFLVTGQLTGVVPGGAINDAVVEFSETSNTLPLMQAFTDFDGRFGIPAVPGGHYLVSARRGVCPASTSLDADGWPSRFQCDAGRSDPQSWSGTATIDLDAHGRLVVDGNVATEIHLAMRPTARGPLEDPSRQPQIPHVANHGSASLNGVITDLDQRQLPFTHVAIFSAALGGARATVTDDQGRFAFNNLPGVSVRLVAAPAGASAVEYGGAGPGTDGVLIAIPDRMQIHIAWRLPR